MWRCDVAVCARSSLNESGSPAEPRGRVRTPTARPNLIQCLPCVPLGMCWICLSPDESSTSVDGKYKKKKKTGCLIVIWRIPLICMPSRADVPVLKWISLMGAQWAACGWCGSRLVFYSKQKWQITLDACWYSSDFYTKSTFKENEFSQFLWKGKSSYKVRWSAPPAGVKFICGWFIAIELL